MKVMVGLDFPDERFQREAARSFLRLSLLPFPDIVTRIGLEELGFRFTGSVIYRTVGPSVLVAAVFPKRWHKHLVRVTSMYSILVVRDQNGCDRIRILLDRATGSHSMVLLPRLMESSVTLSGKRRRFGVYDAEKRRHYLLTEPALDHELAGKGDSGYSRYARRLESEVHRWLKRNFPDYRNPLAYWGKKLIIGRDSRRKARIQTPA